MKITNNEKCPFTHVVSLDYNDLIDLGTGNTKQIATIPAGGAVELVGVCNTTDIVGTTTTVVDIGTTIGDPDEFIDALDVDAATVNLPVFNTGELMVKSAATTTFLGGALPVSATATALPIYLKLTDANIADMTAGEIVIGLRIVDLAGMV